MASFVCGMNQSLDGYVDHTAFDPDPALFGYFIEDVARQTGCVYGRQMYDVMRYWDDDQPDWSEEDRAFAQAWRSNHKWVVSNTLTGVGPNATLVTGDLETAMRTLKDEQSGEIEVAGPRTARSLAEFGLIDEYRIYLHPVAIGSGKPFFAGPIPALKLIGHERLTDDVLRLAYAPA